MGVENGGQTGNQKASISLSPTLDGFVEIFLQTLFPPGMVSLYCCGTHDRATVFTAFALAAGVARNEADHSLVFSSLYLIAPPSSRVSAETLRKDVEELARSFLTGRVPTDTLEANVEALSSRLRISILEIWEVEALAEYVRACERGSAVLVLEAAHLYSATVQLPPPITPLGRSPIGKPLNLRAAEDVWVPRVERAVALLAQAAEAQQLSFAVWTGEVRPSRAEYCERLEQTAHGVLSTSDATASVPNRALELAREGRLDEALLACDEMGSSTNCALLKGHCCEVAGQAPLAYTYVAPHLAEFLAGASASTIAQLARWAFTAGRYEQGRELLGRALAAPEIDESFFDVTLDLAQTVRDEALITQVREGWRRHFPHSRALLGHEVREHFQAGRHSKVVELLGPLVEHGQCEDSERLLWVIARHHLQGPLDYDRLMREVRENIPALLDAAAEYWFMKAFEGNEGPERLLEVALVHPWKEQNASDAAATLIMGLRRLFIAPGGGSGEEHIQLLRRSLERIIEHLSAHPADYRAHRKFIQLLDPAVSGTLLVTLVADAALSAWPWWRGVRPTRRREVKRMPEAHLPAVLQVVMQEMDSLTFVGSGTVPVDKLPCPPDEVLAFFLWMLQHAQVGLAPGASAIKQLEMPLHFALLFARIAGEPNDDIRVRRMAAATLCLNGDFRNARDLAETMLLGIAPGDSSQRRRVAWHTMADFSLRARSLPEALLALACANRCAPEDESEDDLFVECRLWIRVLRDVGLFEPALSLVAEARALFQRLGTAEENLHHIDQLEASIRCGLLFNDLQAGPDAETQHRFLELCEFLASANRRARETDGELQPGMLLLGQLLSEGQLYGLEAPEHIRREFEALLPDIGMLYEPLVRVAARKESSVSVLQSLDWGLQNIRDSEDVGRVVQLYEWMARRELASAAEAGRVIDALYLLEWSMDRGLRNVDEAGRGDGGTAQDIRQGVLNWAGISLHRPGNGRIPEALTRLSAELGQASEVERARDSTRRPPSPAECEQAVAALSRQGVDIHVLGMDDHQTLVRVSGVDGTLSLVREPAEVFNGDALLAWKAAGYPARYALMNSNDFNGLLAVERTLEQVGISAEPGRAAVFVLTAELQAIPPNLLLMNGQLAGSRVAVASTPSLTWLRAAHATPRAPTARRGAWIPTSDAPDEQGTLAAMRDDIQDVLGAHEMPLSCEGRPPQLLSGAELVFIGAHGSIDPQGLFFRVVADERSARFSARELARHVSGAGVIVLAICNGSRIDLNPFARATVGLARLLLDHGCRAVIGSPWSLDISVVRRWVPVFLKHFDAGATVLEANHAANQAVAERFNRHPFHALAMNLLGDPFVTRGA